MAAAATGLGAWFGGLSSGGQAGVLGIGSDLIGGLFGGGESSPQVTDTNIMPFSGTSGLGTTGMAQGGAFTQQLSPQWQQAQQQQMGIGQNYLGQLGNFQNNPFQATPFDLQGTTQNQYNLLEGIQQPQRDQARLAQEERLFAQGRLGGTSGMQEQRNLQDAFGQQQSQNLASAFGQGLAGQQQQYGQQLGQAQQQAAQQQLLGNIGTGMFNSAMAPEELLQRQMQTFGALAPTQTTTSGGESEGGLLGGLFSDERLKDDIKYEGKTKSGINLYSWTWNSIAKAMSINSPEFGVIAQEVMKIIPSAVSMDKSGFYKVDYSEVI
tara:strand:+ start:6634 stop:7602 length:969 start_codon:yes stop_codon:yes gene_type:complete